MNRFQTWAEAHWPLEDGSLIRFTEWQVAAGEAIFPDEGDPPWDTFLLSTVKKAGKTTFDACATAFAALTFPAPETVFVLSNDLLQAQERVFDMIAKAFRRMGLERSGSAVITSSSILLPETGTRIVALAADYAGSAGAIFGVSSWTELWGFRHEGHVRLWEEMTPIPRGPGRRSLRIVDSYAGFAGASPILEPMWERALKGERIHPELPIFTAGRLWAYIDTGEDAQRRAWRGTEAEREAYYVEQRASLRPGTYARLHLNQWQAGEEAFVTSDAWDACTDPNLHPLLPDRGVKVDVGVDAATKKDTAAVVAVSRVGQSVELVAHRIFTPRPGAPLDLEETIEAYVLELSRSFSVRSVRYDPYQMARSAATLQKAGVRMVEYPQTTPNLTASSQALYDAIKARHLRVYPAPDLRQHVLNAVALDSGRGWRIAKDRSTNKVDGCVALSFATVGAVTPPRGWASLTDAGGVA